jgi:DNA gyrase subunit B
MTGGVALKMDNIEQATATAEELKKAINDINIDVQRAWMSKREGGAAYHRRQHGNIKAP